MISDLKQPWKQRKTDLADCGISINVCLQTVKALTTLMAPFMPRSARRCATMLGLGDEALRWDEATRELEAGHPLGKPEVLFRKLDAAELFPEEAPAE